MIVVSALAVIAAGCSTNSEPGAPAVLTKIIRTDVPVSARTRCPDPVTTPDRFVPEREATDLWARDRAALRTCESRRAAAVRAADGVHAADEKVVK